MNEEDNQKALRRKADLLSLRFLLVFSILAAACSVFSDLSFSLFRPRMLTLFNSQTFATMPDIYKIAFENALEIPIANYILDGLLSLLVLWGCWKMWHLKKEGFHFYTLGKLLIIIVSILFLGRANVQLGNIMMAFLFIGLYFFTLKSLGIFEEKIILEENSEDTEE